MRNLILLFLLVIGMPVYAISITGVNPAAVNMTRYYGRPVYNYTNNPYCKTKHPCVYSQQQAKYYGMINVNPYNRNNLYKYRY